jgi:hypothetical protein
LREQQLDAKKTPCAMEMTSVNRRAQFACWPVNSGSVE